MDKKRLIKIIPSIVLMFVAFGLLGYRMFVVNRPRLSDKEIYFFYQDSCSYCHTAQQFIEKNYPDIRMRMINLSNKKNMELFIQCTEKSPHSRGSAGTPLICMGPHVIMGWGSGPEHEFKMHVEKFRK